MKISRIIWVFTLFMVLFSFGQAQLPDAYTRYADALQTMTDLAANNPLICKLDTMGYSTRDSIPMLRLKISDFVNKFLYNCVAVATFKFRNNSILGHYI